MSSFLVSLGWVLLFVTTGLIIGGWEVEAIITALLAGAAFSGAAWARRHDGTLAR